MLYEFKEDKEIAVWEKHFLYPVFPVCKYRSKFDRII